MLDLIHAAHVVAITGSVGSGKTTALIRLFGMLESNFSYVDLFTYERRFERDVQTMVPDKVSECTMYRVMDFDEVYEQTTSHEHRDNAMLIVDDLSVFNTNNPARLKKLVQRYQKTLITQQSSLTSLSLSPITYGKVGLLELVSTVVNNKCFLRCGELNVALDDIIKYDKRRNCLNSLLKDECPPDIYV